MQTDQTAEDQRLKYEQALSHQSCQESVSDSQRTSARIAGQRGAVNHCTQAASAIARLERDTSQSKSSQENPRRIDTTFRTESGQDHRTASAFNLSRSS
jgi:hypothetical protein